MTERKKLFTEIPYLKGERIVLRKITQEDAKPLKKLADSEAVNLYLPTFLFEQKYADIHTVIDRMYTEGMQKSIHLAIDWNGQFCGIAEFYGYKEKRHLVYVGNRLLEEYWGKGISSETLSLMVDYLFGETDIEIIAASVMHDNKVSASVLRKHGFTLAASGLPEDWGYDEPVLEDRWILNKNRGGI